MLHKTVYTVIHCNHTKKYKTTERRSDNNTTQNEILFALIKTNDLEDPLCLTRIDPWDLGEELERIIGGDVKAAKTTRAGNILVVSKPNSNLMIY